MATGATGQLGLALPVQGELSGTWGDTVNNGITQYTNIAIAGTLTLTNDGAVTLANTTGDASASNITSTLTGAGTVTAQFAIVRVTGTLTTAKVVTAPSYSKTYTVVNAATGGIVTFKAAGQTGVSVAVGESALVYFNGTDYVKVAGTASSSQWTTSGSDIYYSTGNVGLKTTTFSSISGTVATLSIGGTNATTSGGVAYQINGTVQGYHYVDTISTVTYLTHQSISGGHVFLATNAEKMRLDASGRLLVGLTSANTSGSNLQVSQGITFPATQSASSDANTLDDYEEGTWTPAFTPNAGAFGSITYFTQIGNYQKIGNTVSVQMYLYLTGFSIGTATGTLFLTGLPFTAASSTQYQSAVVGYTYNWATNSPNKAAVYQGDSRFYLLRDAQGATDSSPEITVSNLKNGNPACTLSVAISYKVA